MSGKILVTGATGNIGSGLVPALRSAGVEVRAFVRDEAKAQPLKDAGAEVIVGDLDKPETINAAVEGVEKIFLLTFNGPTEAQQGLNVIEAAKQVGSPHVVRLSGWGSEKSRIVKNQQEIHKALKSSGLSWTIVQPTFFMQNIMMAAQTITSDGNMYWPMKDGKVAMIDVRDVVDASLAVLTGSGHEGKTYILTGPAAISFHDVAGTLTKILGNNVNYVSVPGEAAKESMVGMGVPEWIAMGYVEMFEGFGEGFAENVQDGMIALTGKPGRSFEQFANDFKQVFSG
ncbi:MAG: SDR family oxidoreductase [SAR324 cluster bacterium]|nr:SDR family oxidoreductase [SAR324 cluster bacterium]